jgi:hypothetical protein
MLEALTSNFHLRLDEIAELTPLQIAWYLSVIEKQIKEIKKAQRRRR